MNRRWPTWMILTTAVVMNLVGKGTAVCNQDWKCVCNQDWKCVCNQDWKCLWEGQCFKGVS